LRSEGGEGEGEGARYCARLGHQPIDRSLDIALGMIARVRPIVPPVTTITVARAVQISLAAAYTCEYACMPAYTVNMHHTCT
jgi:hypothetical protein